VEALYLLNQPAEQVMLALGVLFSGGDHPIKEV